MQAQRDVWAKCNKRQAVRAGVDVQAYGLAVGRGVTNAGGPRIPVSTDVLPVVIPEGLPTKEFPKYCGVIAGYTLAVAAAEDPSLAHAIWTSDWMRLSLIVTAMRVGVWVSTGIVPTQEGHACGSLLRWSASAGKLVARPPGEDHMNKLVKHSSSVR